MDDRYRLHHDQRLFDITNLPTETLLSPNDLSEEAAAARARLHEVLKAFPIQPSRQHREPQ